MKAAMHCSICYTYYGYTYCGSTYYGALKAAMHCSIWARVQVPLMTAVLHARCRLQARASSVGETPYFSASATYCAVASMAMGMPGEC